MSYSRETERQNKVLSDLLSGKTPEKRAMVGYEGEEQKKGDIESELTSIMKDVRMPWFCPECNKTMKIKLDDKMWRLFGHCFDCQVKMENKLRIQGKFDEWAKKKVKANQKAHLEDLLVSVREWKEKAAKVEYLEEVGVQNLEMEQEKWSVNQDHINKLAEEAEDFIKKQLKELM